MENIKLCVKCNRNENCSIKDKTCKKCRKERANEIKNRNRIIKKPECYIYVITNDNWPGWIKIGRASNLKSRLYSYQTSSPFRNYEIYYSLFTSNIYEIEKYFFDKYGNKNGEWYYIDKDEAVDMIIKINKNDNY